MQNCLKNSMLPVSFCNNIQWIIYQLFSLSALLEENLKIRLLLNPESRELSSPAPKKADEIQTNECTVNGFDQTVTESMLLYFNVISLPYNMLHKKR